jgi:hypothetical protein
VRPIRTISESEYNELARLSAMTRDQVRGLWDQYDGCNSPDGISAEMIHHHLNAIGDGIYCAV